MMKRLIAALLTVLSLLALPLTALGSQALETTVVLPYVHVWKTDVPKADDHFTYRWTVQTPGAPMPKGADGSWWDWQLKGNTQGDLSLSFTYDTPGSYSYRLAAYVPQPVEGYVYEQRTFLLTVLVQNASGGALRAEWYLLNEGSGEKVDRIDLDPSYSSGKQQKEPEPESKADSSSGSGSTSAKEEQSSEEQSTSDKKKQSSGGKSTSAKQKQSSGSRSTKSVKTGDESRLESMLVIFSVSALLLAYLIYEELREHRTKRK